MCARCIAAPFLLGAAVLVAACAHDNPTGPSPLPTPPPVATVTDEWNVTVRLTAVSDGECVGDMMQFEMGVPKSYRLSIAPKGSIVDVTLRSASGDYVCTFPARAEPDGFTTFGVPGFMSCETSGVVRNYACEDGTRRDLLRLGQDISGHISGNEISGEWQVGWIVMTAGGDLGGRDDIAALQTTAHYTGTR